MFWNKTKSMARQTDAPGTSGGYIDKFISFFTMPKSGIKVDEHVALTYSAVWACVRIISEGIAILPWHVLHNDGDKRTIKRDHPVDYLLHKQPNPETSSFIFRETITAHALLNGNGYAEIERSLSGDPVALWIITPNRVTPKRDPQGRLYYEVSNEGGTTANVPSEDMLHLKGLSYDGLVGYGVIELAQETISMGLAAEGFGASFFGNGAVLSGVITKPAGSGKLEKSAILNLLKSFRKRHVGAGKNHKVEFLDQGMEYKQIGIPPEQAQFLESRRFQVLDICRWFGVKPHKVAELERSTNNNIEHQAIEHVTDTLAPWVRRWEQEVDVKLFKRPERDRYDAKMNMKALLRGDIKTRGEFYKIMTSIGAYSINDVLRLEDENPIGSEGDLRLVPMNMVSITQAYRDGKTAVTKTRSTDSVHGVFLDVAERMHRKEVKAVTRASQKFESDYQGFAAWCDEFYGTQAEQMEEAYQSAEKALQLLATGGVTPKQSASALNGFSRNYATECSELIKVTFDQGDTNGGLQDIANRIPETIHGLMAQIINNVKGSKDVTAA